MEGKCCVLLVTLLAALSLASAACAASWKKKVAAEVGAASFNSGILVFDVSNGDKYEHNADKSFPSASIIKLFVLWELFDRVGRGDLKLSETITFDRDRAVDGGILHKFSSGAILRLEDLAMLMLAVSDNTATNLLIDRLGIDKINATIQATGAKETILGRKMLDFEARKAGKDNFTSARDVGMILERILKGNPRMLEMLSVQKNISKLPALLPFEDPDDLEPILAHKTGELTGKSHDAGVFFYRTPRPVIAVVLTSDVPTLSEGCEFNARIGKIVYDAFLPK